MSEYRLTVNGRGRVTLPDELLKRLGLASGGKVVFREQDDEIVFEPADAANQPAPGMASKNVPDAHPGP